MFNFNTIKKIRIFKELSGNDLAKKCGISQCNISQIENNKRPGTTVNTVEKILNSMGFRLIVAHIPEENKCPCHFSTGGTTVTFKEEVVNA